MNRHFLPNSLLPWYTSLLLVSFVGCSAPAYPAAFRQARRAENAGDLPLARQKYSQVFHSDGRAADRAAAGMRLASVLVRLGRIEDAVSTYLKVESGPGQGKREGARALFRAGSLLADRLGKANRAETLWRKVIIRYPDTVAAQDALSRLLARFFDRFSPKQILNFLADLTRKLPGTALAPHVAWEAARICRSSLSDPACAFSWCRRTWKAAPRGSLADDALICAARQARAMGKPRVAQVWYRRLLGTREDAVIVGSYHSEWLDDALFELGILYLDNLRDTKRAIETFKTLKRSYPSSILRDDAQWWICLARLRQGRRAKAMACWHRLVSEFPSSRFVREKPALADWGIVAAALSSRNPASICRALRVHAEKHPFGWFRRRRETLQKRYRCP